MRQRLRHRIIFVVAFITLGASLLFSLYTLVFIYAVEDAFLNLPLEAERSHQIEERTSSGHWAATRDTRIALHTTLDTLPVEIGARLSDEPKRVEFPGAGISHYHLMRIEAADGGFAWLVYDAGAQLIVKPMRNKLIGLLACTTLVLLILALGAGYWASRGTTHRLEQLATAVSNLDPQQLPATWQADDSARDEVSLVSRALDSMAQRLRGFVERERSFTRDASHELRTPLAVIRSAGDQIATQPELTARSRQHAQLIRESTFRLEQTVSTLLALAREQDIEDHGACVPVLPLIERAILDHAPRLEGRPVSVVVDVPPDACLAAPEPVASIVLANLIANAFAHASRGAIKVYVEADRLCISNPIDDEREPLPVARGGHDLAQDHGFGLGIVQRLCDKFSMDFSLALDDQRGLALAAVQLAKSPENSQTGPTV